jgi:hypothetical protein
VSEQTVSEQTITVTVSRSAGADGAFIVLVDTDFEPDGSDGSPALRIGLNDHEVFVGKAYEPSDYERTVGGKERTLTVAVADIPYWCHMVPEGKDTDGSEWNRCTVHDELVLGDAYVCEGYEPPPYKEGGR